jgi:hypothetical protein
MSPSARGSPLAIVTLADAHFSHLLKSPSDLQESSTIQRRHRLRRRLGSDTSKSRNGSTLIVRRLGILTRDFKVLHELVRRLNARGTTYRVLDHKENIPADVGAILVSWRDFPAFQTPGQRTIDGKPAELGLPTRLPIVSVRLDDSGEEDYDRAISEGLRRLSGTERYERLVVGIDPGERPGLAFLGDGSVVHTAQLPDEPAVLDHLKHYLPSFPAGEVIVRIGHGARLSRNRLLNDLLGLAMEDVRLEVVDETATNPIMARRPTAHLSRDIQAAIGIAMQRGHIVERRVLLDVRPGEIADIQRRSRIASEGKITVDRKLATRVAKGEITLMEAIEHQRGRGRSGKAAT